jgi:release factor glutamine methyltransferase
LDYSLVVTVLEVIQRSTGFLGRKGVDAPRLQIELLLAHVLQLPRLNLYVNFDKTLTTKELETIRQLVQRRGNHEPLQYILGSACFCGLEMLVTPDVMIPRPETELLAERAWQYLNALTDASAQPPCVLDFGTGSGCVAIAIAVHCPLAQVYAVEISPGALAIARANTARHHQEARIRFFEGDGLAPLAPELRFDLIVANPPYIASADLDQLQPEVRDHEPRAALDGGADGLVYFRRLAIEAGRFLRHSGRLMLEFGDGQAERIREILHAHHWEVEAVHNDYTGRPRMLTSRRLN